MKNTRYKTSSFHICSDNAELIIIVIIIICSGFFFQLYFLSFILDGGPN